MAKLLTLFILLIAIQACLMIYTAQDPAETDLWTFIMNMDNWDNLNFILAIVGIAGGIGVIGLAAGSVFGFKTDFLIMASAIYGLISIGVIFTHLANVVRDELISRFFPLCYEGLITNCNIVNLIVALFVGVIAFVYAWTVVEWWRGKDF